MKKWMALLMVAGFTVFAASAQTVLEQWTFDTEADGTSFTNLVNTGTEGAAHFGDDLAGAYVTNGMFLIAKDETTNNVFKVAEMTATGLDSGVYELSWTFPAGEMTGNNSAYGIYIRSAETLNALPPSTKSSSDLFQFRIHVISGVPNIQTRVMEADGGAGIANHGTLPNIFSNVYVRLTVDLDNDLLEGEVVHNGTTTTVSRTMLDLTADFVRFHATPLKQTAGQDVAFDDIRWSFLREGELKDVVLIDYQMDDSAGTEPADLAQTGADGGSFNSSATNMNIETDGLGNLVYTNILNNDTAFHTMTEVFSNGVVELEYKISEWDFTGFDTANNNINFQLFDNLYPGGTEDFTLALEWVTEGATRIKWKPGGVDADIVRQTLDITNGTDLVVKTQVDLDAGTYSAFYNLGGTGWVVAGVDQAMNLPGFVLRRIKLGKDGSPVWPAGAYAKVDYARVVRPTPRKLVDFQFDDAVGTDLKDLWNNGSVPSNWNFNATGEIMADGNGNLQFLDVTNAWTRKVELGDAALTAGKVEMKWRLDGWDLAGLAASDGFTFGLKDTNTSEVIKSKFFLTADSLDTRMTMTDASGAAQQRAGFGITNGAEGVSFWLVADLKEKTFNGYYKMDSGSWTQITVSNNAGLARIDEIQLTVNPGWTGDKTGFANVDYLTLRYISIDPTTPEGWYAQWAYGFSGFSDIALDSNPDDDAVNNLYEYGLGGDPTDGADIGYVSTIQNVAGADYVEYVHVQRDNGDERGLSYSLALADSLILANWTTNSGYTVTGTNVNFETGFEQVTNRVSTADKDEKYIKLIIEANFTP